MLKRVISATASRSVASGDSVIGLRIIPLSDRFTRSTSAAWRSIDMFLWSTPMPPARAIAIAISDSVTVSIAAETSGTFSAMPRVNRVAVSTSRGCVSEWRGEQQDVVEREGHNLTDARRRGGSVVADARRPATLFGVRGP